MIPWLPIDISFTVNHWIATGKLCHELVQTVYRIYVLGAFNKDTRQAHLREAAIETFKYAIIRGEDKYRVLAEADKLTRKI